MGYFKYDNKISKRFNAGLKDGKKVQRIKG